MKKGYVIILVMLLGILITGCSPVTTIKMDEQGKGTLTYKMDIKKNAIEKDGYTVAKNIDEFAELLESKMAESLEFKVSVDKISSNEYDYLIFTTSYNSIEEYNSKVKEAISQYNQLLHEQDPMEEMFGYSDDMYAKDYSSELEALKEYMSDKGITVDVDNRNCRKFAKIIREYEQTDYLYDYDPSEENEDDKKLSTKDEIEQRKYVRIVEGESGKTLNIDFMALNAIEMYIRKFVEVKNSELFNVSYIEENTQNVTMNGNKEVLKRAFEKFDLATKVKNIIDAKKGTKPDTYSMNDFTPVMTVTLFDDETAEKFTEIYNKEYIKYKTEKKNSGNSSDITFDDMIDMYDERKSQYEVTFGDNTITFDGDSTFELYNDDNYIEVGSKTNSRRGVSTSGCIDNTVREDENKITEENTVQVNNKTSLVSSKQKKNDKVTSSKKGKNIVSNLFDDTPVTGDSFDIILVVTVAIISLGVAIIIRKHRTSSL